MKFGESIHQREVEDHRKLSPPPRDGQENEKKREKKGIKKRFWIKKTQMPMTKRKKQCKEASYRMCGPQT